MKQFKAEYLSAEISNWMYSSQGKYSLNMHVDVSMMKTCYYKEKRRRRRRRKRRSLKKEKSKRIRKQKKKKKKIIRRYCNHDNNDFMWHANLQYRQNMWIY